MIYKNDSHNINPYEHFLPPDAYTHVCVSEGQKYLFFGKFGAFCFLSFNTRFEICPFALLPIICMF